MRDLDQIQECDPDESGRRIGTIILASVAFLGVSAAVGVMVGRAARSGPDPEVGDPLAELDTSNALMPRDKKPASQAAVPLPKVEATQLSFPVALTEREERPEVLAALADAAAEEAALRGARAPAAPSATASNRPEGNSNQQPSEPAIARIPAALPASVAAGPAERALSEAAKHDPLVETSIPKRPTQTRAPRGEEGEFTLQVISYDRPEPARQFAEGLRAKGHKAFVMEADIPNRGRYYRVRIGPFKNRFRATRYRREFEDAEQMNTYVVRRDR
ncbi:MAG: SPOR domain-containing protein [Myxococcales bacterium]|nr:SPOR domain-containing protein [Myxococcales bacterium]